MTMAGEIPRQAQKYTVRDEHRSLEFTGVQLAAASSENEYVQRWTEIEVYKTQAGKFVVHRAGVSLTYHRLDAPCASGKVVRFEDLDAVAESCKDCKPPHKEDAMARLKVRREMDRHSAEVVEGVEALVAALSLRRPNGSPYLSAVAADVLNQAAENDTEINAVVHSTVHID